MFLLFFDYCHRRHWYYLKDCLVILCFKSAEVRNSEVYQKKIVACRSKFDNRSLLLPTCLFKMILTLKLLTRNVMLQNSINLMVQTEFSPGNCPLSSTFVYICQSLSFESLLSRVSLLSKVSKQCFVFGHFHKTTNQLWIKNSKITGLKGYKKY